MGKFIGKAVRWVLILGGVAFFVGACLFIFVLRPQQANNRDNAANSGFVEKRTINDTLTTAGSVRPTQVINLSFEVTGKVMTLNVDENSRVKAGDVLATLETDSLARAVEQAKLALAIQQANFDTVNKPPTPDQVTRAQATLAQAKAALSQAQAQFDNQKNAIASSCATLETVEQAYVGAKEAYDNYVQEGYQFDVEFRPDPNSPAGRALKNTADQRDVVQANCDAAKRTQSGDANVLSAQAQIDQAQAALDTLLKGATDEQKAVATAQLEQAKLNLQNAEANLANASLLAPVDGIVLTVNIAPGQMISPSGQPAIVLADTSAIYIETSVDENDIARVQAGQKVQYTLQGTAENVTFNGEVESASVAGQSSQGVISFPVRIKLSAPLPPYLYMTADISIILSTTPDALLVPSRAVRRRDDGTRYVVVERSDATTTEINVEAGLVVGSLLQVTGEGLREGQKVLIEPRRTQPGN
jgi:HlyD family secretion protein